jgi:enoyl-CoA hydratase/carnithine racemase
VEDVLQTLTSLAKPVLAALRGWCLGAGVMVALAADLRLAGDDLRMGIPAARLGVAYPRGGVERLVAVAGPAAAAELLMTAEPYEAQEALRRGLVDRLHPAAGLMERAQTLAEVMAEGAPLTLAAAKLAVASALHPSDTAAAEAADAAARACYASRDFQEGQRAFIEKRRPAFEGR